MYHGQSRGKRNSHKVCKNQVNLSKTGWEIFQSRGENNNFRETGGNVLNQGHYGGGNSKFVVDD